MLRLYPTFDGQRTSLHGRVLVRDEANAFITFEEPRSVGVTVVYHHISRRRKTPSNRRMASGTACWTGAATGASVR